MEKCFIIEYLCKGGTPGRQIVIAETADNATEKFFKAWDEETEQGIAISRDELKSYKIEEWCNRSDLIS